MDTVTKHGTVIYNVGKDALRDDGASFCVSLDASLDAAILALTVTKQRFGNVLRLAGNSAFCDRMIHAAVTGQVPPSASPTRSQKPNPANCQTPSFRPEPGRRSAPGYIGGRNCCSGAVRHVLRRASMSH